MSLQTQVLSHFASKQIHLSHTFVSSLLGALHPHPLTLTPAILANFHTAFLLSSLQQAASPQSCLPPSIPTQHNITLPGPSLVQIIHVQDIGTSRLAQLEALEKAETEKGPQGRRVVDLPADGEGEDNPVQDVLNEGLSVGKSICKVLLEDGRGERVYGMEVKPIDNIKVGMHLGCKVLLVNVPVLRGVLQLRPTNTTILGGKIAELDDGYFPVKWKQEMEGSMEEIKRQTGI